MAQITVTKTEDLPQAIFEVIVTTNTMTHHKVSLAKDYYEKLTNGKISPEKLIEKSFQFLLIREPNTSILSQFNLTTISDYFPEYEKEIKEKSQPEDHS